MPQIFTCLLLALLASSVPAQELPAPGAARLDCARIVAHGGSLDKIYTCIDVYWHGEQPDNPPNSYSNVIKLLYMAEKKDPGNWENFTTSEWLLYSQWKAWYTDPVANAYGKDKDKEAVAVILQGRRRHMNSFQFHMQSGEVLEGLAQHYKPEYYDFVRECYGLAYRAAAGDKEKVRALLSTGHTYRHQGDKVKAIEYYRRVLAIDPANQPALNYIKQLGEPAAAAGLPPYTGSHPAAGFDLPSVSASSLEAYGGAAETRMPLPLDASDRSDDVCAGGPLAMRLRGRTVTLPASGIWTLESHLATSEDVFPGGRAFPHGVKEEIERHLSRSISLLPGGMRGAGRQAVYRTRWDYEWTPPENGRAGQGAVGGLKPKPEEEMWIFNMMWLGKSMPKPGTKFLATYNGRSVVVVGGYERGPSSRRFLGGFQPEVFWYLGAEEGSSRVTLSALSDQSLPPGPIDCN